MKRRALTKVGRWRQETLRETKRERERDREREGDRERDREKDEVSRGLKGKTVNRVTVG